jgi:hypothetical protein
MLFVLLYKQMESNNNSSLLIKNIDQDINSSEIETKEQVESINPTCSNIFEKYLTYNQNNFDSFNRKLFVIGQNNSSELLKHSIICGSELNIIFEEAKNNPIFYKKYNADILENFMEAFELQNKIYRYVHVIIDDTCFITIINKTNENVIEKSLYYLYENATICHHDDKYDKIIMLSECLFDKIQPNFFDQDADKVFITKQNYNERIVKLNEKMCIIQALTLGISFLFFVRKILI